MARSSVTAKQLLYDAKSLLGNRESIKPNDAEGIRFINYSLFTLSNLLDGLYRTWETATSSLTRLRGAVGVSFRPVGAGDTYAYATKTITAISAHGLTQALFKHGLVVMYDMNDGKAYVGVIESIPSATTIKLVEDPRGSNITDLGFAAIAYPWYSDGANLSSLNIKSLLAVKDVTNGDVIRLNGREFESFHDNPNLEGSVGMWDFGDGVHIEKGADVSAFGSLTLYYAADPAEVTAITDSVDMEMEHHAALVADIARQIELAYPEVGKRQVQTDPFADLRKLYDTMDFAFASKQAGYDVAGRAEKK